MRPTITVPYLSPAAKPPSARPGGLQRLAGNLSTLANTVPTGITWSADTDAGEADALAQALLDVIDALAEGDAARELIEDHAELGSRARRLMRARGQLWSRGDRLLARLLAARAARRRAPVREIIRFAGLVSRHAAAERGMWISAEFLDLGGSD